MRASSSPSLLPPREAPSVLPYTPIPRSLPAPLAGTLLRACTFSSPMCAARARASTRHPPRKRHTRLLPARGLPPAHSSPTPVRSDASAARTCNLRRPHLHARDPCVRPRFPSMRSRTAFFRGCAYSSRRDPFPARCTHVCLLQKSLYGLKQAPRAWHQQFATYLCRLDFTPSASDASLFIDKDRDNVAYLLVYVDDIILMASSPDLLRRITTRLSSEFTMTSQ